MISPEPGIHRPHVRRRSSDCGLRLSSVPGRDPARIAALHQTNYASTCAGPTPAPLDGALL